MRWFGIVYELKKGKLELYKDLSTLAAAVFFLYWLSLFFIFSYLADETQIRSPLIIIQFWVWVVLKLGKTIATTAWHRINTSQTTDRLTPNILCQCYLHFHAFSPHCQLVTGVGLILDCFSDGPRSFLLCRREWERDRGLDASPQLAYILAIFFIRFLFM